MIIPAIDTPEFKMKLPVSNKEVFYRPMIQKDEKILLIAKEGNDPSEILNAIKQVVQNCLYEKGIKPDNLEPMRWNVNTDEMSIVDLEWAFIKLRSTSIRNISKVSYRDGEDEEIRNFDVNLDQVNVLMPNTEIKTIAVTETISVDLRYPPGWLYSDKDFMAASGEEALERLGSACIASINDNGKVTAAKTIDKEEMLAFTLSWPVPVYQKLTEFISDVPHLNYEINYKNNMGHERKITLSSLNDFFTFA